MMQSIEAKYAQLLVEYCLEIQKGDRLLVQTTLLAEPLVREVYRLAMRKGAHVVTNLSFQEQNRIFYEEASEEQLKWHSPLQEAAMESFEAYLFIRAPYNLREDQSIDPQKRKVRSIASQHLQQTYSTRTADRSLKRCLCQYPTQAAAQQAGMSLEEYQHFVYDACKLFRDNPEEAWLEVRRHQQTIVDYLNQCKEIRYKNGSSDIKFRVEGRRWMNSDGQTNMPSGEVYTAPIEDSVEGYIHFDFPSIYQGHPVKGITLWVEDGEVVRWEAREGQELLDKIFEVEGARRFGEVAIGTNYNIQRPTGNILFDEKIGGTVHMAVGQAYFQTGGKNKSSVHWDMIAEMKHGGEIWADDTLIYQNGVFTIT